jgi:uroporphyrinogen-III synthase
MRALITRPQDDAAEITAALQARGMTVISEPLLTICPREGAALPENTAQAQGLLITSANGIRAFAALTPLRHWPVWTVGDASARTARVLGFTDVTSAAGDVDSLTALIVRTCRPGDGPLLHAAGSVVAGDLGGQLAQAGFDVRKLDLYRAETATSLTPETIRALQSGELDCILIYSPRTAQTLARLIRLAGLEETLQSVQLFCLSDAVAKALTDLPCAGLHKAAEPTQTALLDALDRWLAAHTSGKGIN